MAIELQQHGTISYGATRNVSVDLTLPLQGGGTLTGTPTIIEADSSDVAVAGGALTIANKQVSIAALDILGRTVAIGKAIQCTVSGQVKGSTYRLLLGCATTGSPAETEKYVYVLHCV